MCKGCAARREWLARKTRLMAEAVAAWAREQERKAQAKQPKRQSEAQWLTQASGYDFVDGPDGKPEPVVHCQNCGLTNDTMPRSADGRFAWAWDSEDCCGCHNRVAWVDKK